MFRVFFSSHGERAFGVLSKEVQTSIVEELTRLAQDPFWCGYFYEKGARLLSPQNLK
jgi:hypothetical protein